MNYNDYKISRNLSWEIILNEKICALPVRMSALCRQMGIAVKTDEALSTGGYTHNFNGTPIIFVSASDSTERQRFTTAHELGHILLGHVGKYELVNREPSPNDNPIEQAANVFASRLLAPACVLWGCGVRSADEIAELCKISRIAAEYRFTRLTELYERNKFLTSPLERKVYQQFSEFIEQNQLH